MFVALATFAGQAATVYKWTDSDGVVHYSDQPVPGAEKISTGSSPTAPGRPPAGAAAPVAATSVAKGLGYNRFFIAAPAPEQTFFGDQAVSVQLSLDPLLKPGHTITWHLNGQEVGDPGGSAVTTLNLPRLDRGSYIIAATITDPNTGESLTTPGVTFYVRQPSALAPLQKKP